MARSSLVGPATAAAWLASASAPSAVAGATRISVARTTPTMGEASARPHKTYPPMPAATRTSPSAMIPLPVRLSMRAPSLDQRRGHHRKHEIDDGESPQAAPVAHHLPEG